MYNRYGDWWRGLVYPFTYQFGGVNVVIDISEELKKFLRRIPMNILSELSSITQDMDFIYSQDEDGDESIIWRKIDALSQQISYAYREGNNPEEVKIVDIEDYNFFFKMAREGAEDVIVYKMLNEIMKKYG